MSTLNIDVSGKILTSNDIVSINISVETILRPGEAYGIGVLPVPIHGITFFNAFDMIGIGRGYFTDPLQVAYGPRIYGYGRELTQTIRESIDEITATISVTPIGVYHVLFNVRGPGQPYLFFNGTSYGTTSSATSHFTYDGLTDANGRLQIKVGVPFSGNVYNMVETDENGRVIISDSQNKSAGFVELIATVLNKISNPDSIPVTGTVISSLNTLSIPITGTIS